MYPKYNECSDWIQDVSLMCFLTILQISNTQTKIWQRIGTQEDDWKNGLVQFSPSAAYTVNAFIHVSLNTGLKQHSEKYTSMLKYKAQLKKSILIDAL